MNIAAPAWDIHLLHAKNEPGDETPCLECEINKNQRQRIQDEIDRYGSYDAIPIHILWDVCEANRKEWVEFGSATEGGETVHRRNKTELLTKYCDENIGATVTAQDLANAVECSIGTAHAFIRDYRFRFLKNYGGRYVIADLAAIRVAEAAATLPQDGRDGAAATSGPVAMIVPPTARFGGAPGKL